MASLTNKAHQIAYHDLLTDLHARQDAERPNRASRRREQKLHDIVRHCPRCDANTERVLRNSLAEQGPTATTNLYRLHESVHREHAGV
jgi:hypothetical protein